MRGVRLLACAVSAALVLGACGADPAVSAAEARVIEPLDADALPAQLLGLDVQREDISEILDGARRPYLDAASLYSLRDGKELQATLQIGRFASDADFADEGFRSTLLSTLGGGSIRQLRVGDEAVFLTTGDRQQIAAWFQDRYLFVLSTRDEFEQPRSLLREALELRP